VHTSELPFPSCISLRQTGAAQDQWIIAKRHEEARQLTSIFYQFLIKRVLIERDGLLPNYRFGQTIKKSERELTDERLNLIVINAVVPTLFAYGRVKAREDYCDLAFDLMEQCKAERNEITKYWEQLGVRSMNAGDSQSLIQLQREYCNKHQCLRCRFGYEFLKK